MHELMFESMYSRGGQLQASRAGVLQALASTLD